MANTSSEGKTNSQVCPICGGSGYLRRDVPVGHPDFGRPIPCQCKRQELEKKRLADIRTMSNLQGLERMTFETFEPQGFALSPLLQANLRHAYELAMRFAAKPEGWLLLRGAYGCGKTHLAAAIANHLVERGQHVLFVVVPDLLDHLRATFSPDSRVSYDERFETVRTAPVLILDDLGTENLTPWAREKLFQIFNYRYNARLPTVITTNRVMEEIDERIRSRLLDQDICKYYTILARDFRAGAHRHSELSSLNLLADKTFDNFDLRERELTPEEGENLRYAWLTAQEYAKEPHGWLVITGSYGVGKTHLAAAIANYRVAQGFPAIFVVVPDLLDHLRATYDPRSPVSYDKRSEEIRAAPLLVLDDLGAQSSTPWAQEKLFQFLNHRYNAKLPTVVTMSLSLEELEQKEPRLAVRMLDRTLVIHIGIIAPAYHAEQPREVLPSGTARQRATRGRRRGNGPPP